MDVPSASSRRGVIAFVTIAYGFSWACALGFVLFAGTRAEDAPGVFRAVAALCMFGPALATFIVGRWVAPVSSFKRDTGLGLGRHWVRFGLGALLGAPLVVLGATLLSVLAYPGDFDLSGLSALRALLRETLPADVLAKLEQVMGIHGFLALQVGQGMVLGPFLNLPFVLGEEWGWRGYLLPRVLPLGTWRALVLSGIIWGVWHAPLILLGYNYPAHPVAGVFVFTGLCVLMGILLGWMRLATGSLWPAVLAHGSLNALSAVPLLLGHAGTPLDTLQVGVTGWPGILVLSLLVGLLVGCRRIPVPG